MDAESHWEEWQRVIQGDEFDAMEVLAIAAMYQRYFQEIQSGAVNVLHGEGRTSAGDRRRRGGRQADCMAKVADAR